MSLRLQMLQVARLAPKVLGDSVGLVRDFLLSQQHTDGGFMDRGGNSDLYYTVFALDGLTVLKADPSRGASPGLGQIRQFLSRCESSKDLDFVHVCCLARAWAALESLEDEPAAPRPHSRANALEAKLRAYRSKDGGFSADTRSEHGTAYGGFLGLGAYEDLKLALPEPMRLVQSFKFLETPDGAWTNEAHLEQEVGSTNATAATVTVLRHLGIPVSSVVADWLLARAHPQGGFVAVPDAPMPDLLSTATALHALAAMEADVGSIKDKCLDFVDTLWTNEGGFHGSWADDALDCEYTFYGLLALGHLSL